MKKNIFKLVCVAASMLFILNGCGGGGDGAAATTAAAAPTPSSGIIVDSPVQGLKYSTPTITGVTDASGTFTYNSGETVTFSVGGVTLGSAAGQSTVTLFTLVPTATSVNDQRIVNIAKFLQSLHTGTDPISTRIVISDAVKTAIGNAGSINFDQTTTAFSNDVNVNTVLTATGKTLLSDGAVTTHLTSQIANLALINTEFGNVQGKLSSLTSSMFWGGIPYAAPPVNSLRWKAPTDPTAWGTTLTTTLPGNACMQKGTVSDTLLGTITQSEDCLTLNIWRPASGETNLPVVVYVHGGSNVNGYGGANSIWGGTMASEQKVIFVTINYRLNLFGWLNHTTLKTGSDPLSDSGNFGTLDIVQALKFVKNNITKFGGNPSNVTLAGESAGGTNVWSMIVSPNAAGLFHKAMPMSGALSTSKTPATGQTFGDVLLQHMVIRDSLAVDIGTANTYLATLTSDQIKTYLYSKTAAYMIGMLSIAPISTTYGGIPPNIFMDGVVQPPDNATALTGSFLNNVPMLAGNTNEEGKLWGSYFSLGGGSWNSIFSSDPNNPTLDINNIVNPSYLPASKPFTSCSDAGYNALNLNAAFVLSNSATYCSNSFYNTTFFWTAHTTALNRYQPLQPKTYAYNFAWAQQPEPMKTLIGAAHAADIAFMFGNANPNTGGFSAGYSTANAAGRQALSLKMRNSLGAFMRNGDPNDASLGATWLPWSTASGGINRMVFDADYNNAILTMSLTNAPIPQ